MILIWRQSVSRIDATVYNYRLYKYDIKMPTRHSQIVDSQYQDTSSPVWQSGGTTCRIRLQRITLWPKFTCRRRNVFDSYFTYG